MKAIYAEPMTKVMFLNVNASICEDERPASEPKENNDPQEDMPLF